MAHVTEDVPMVQMNEHSHSDSRQDVWQSLEEGWVCLNGDGACKDGVIKCRGYKREGWRMVDEIFEGY